MGRRGKGRGDGTGGNDEGGRAGNILPQRRNLALKVYGLVYQVEPKGGLVELQQVREDMAGEDPCHSPPDPVGYRHRQRLGTSEVAGLKGPIQHGRLGGDFLGLRFSVE